MTELRITRGRDILLCCNDVPLYGVTHFTAVSKYEQHEVGEYLCGESVAVLKTGESHVLTFKVLSLFSNAAMSEDGFTITVEDGDYSYHYENCSVTRCERDARGDKNVTDIYTVTATKMTKRGIEDAG